MIRIRHFIPLAVCLLATTLFGQETRGTILGRVIDPHAGVVGGAAVSVLNLDTNTVAHAVTNETGYYELKLLLPGNYQVTVEAAGFKRIVRNGILLQLGQHLEVDATLEVGAVAETVTVTSEAPLIEANVVTSGRTIDTRKLQDIPVVLSNSFLLAWHTPGVMTNGINENSVSEKATNLPNLLMVNGGVGGNSFSIDGMPDAGQLRRVAHTPQVDSVAEFRIETSNFDASVGQTTGLVIAMQTKAGTNQIHGTASELNWQERLSGTPFFSKQAYYRSIAQAEGAGDTALANQIRNTDKQPSGRENNYAATLGGPVYIPHVYNGKNKLFFFFGFSGYRTNRTVEADKFNYTVPTLANRQGDFSNLLKVNSSLYQIYDPLSARPDPARPTHFIRDPIPGNIVPKARIVNPAYQEYAKLFPAPNNDPTNPNLEPVNNLVEPGIPYIETYSAAQNRMDYQLSPAHRFYGRWSYNNYFINTTDFTYQTMPGLTCRCQVQHNGSGGVNYVWTKSASTVFNASASGNQFSDGIGVANTVIRQFKPSDVGLPTYLDVKAGSQHVLPTMSFSGYNTLGSNYVPFLRNEQLSGSFDVTHITGKHTLRAGFDVRQQFKNGGGGGNTSGSFSFTNNYTRRNDDTFTPAGTYGLSWAAFMMGIPTTSTVDTNDTFALQSPYYGWFVQDNWRLTSKLSLTIGLRAEYEQGATERYNRVLGAPDLTAKLPISDMVQAAYAKNPIPELPASAFQVLGGSTYPGVNGVSRRLYSNQLMWLPRFAAAYQISTNTVLRAGYGVYYDTLNVLNFNAPDQTGFSRTTTTTASNDFGATWNAGNPVNGVPPITDPFPVRGDGTRFDAPVRDALGLLARAGSGWSYVDGNRPHARQQHWRVSLDHQIGAKMVVNVAYAGSYANHVELSQTISVLPQQYWATGNVRNAAIDSNLNSNVTNPFYIGNLTSLKTSDPTLYSALSASSFFSSPTIAKNVLLRSYPVLNPLTDSTATVGKVRTHELDLSLERRFAKGFSLSVGYTRLKDDAADFFQNQFDTTPTWRTSNNGRPSRLVGTCIYEFPFGKGRHFFQKGILNYILGGFQVAATYEYQPGPLVQFGNLFYYGNLDQIRTSNQTLSHWFNTDNFETNSAKAPGTYATRAFPTQIDGLRADITNQWNTSVERNFKIKEGIVFQARIDALNLQNRSQFAAPNANPLSTTFGTVTSQTSAMNRNIQMQGRIRF